MHFLAHAWLLFTITETVLCLSPGPAVLLVLSVGLTRGWQPGMQASASILVANLLYFVLSATSLGTMLLASWELFVLIKWLGAAYLIWLGLTTMLAHGDATRPVVEPLTLPRTVVYLQPAGKYKRPAWRPSQGQKGLDERALMASQWSSHP